MHGFSGEISPQGASENVGNEGTEGATVKRQKGQKGPVDSAAKRLQLLLTASPSWIQSDITVICRCGGARGEPPSPASREADRLSD